MGEKPTIAISHLGCEKNRIDTEHMLGLLVNAGYGVDSNEELADYVIVNTCSFIEAARQESVKTLVELAEANKKNRNYWLHGTALSRTIIGRIARSRSGGRDGRLSQNR